MLCSVLLRYLRVSLLNLFPEVYRLYNAALAAFSFNIIILPEKMPFH